jgi:hypothetical protein
MQRFFLTMTFSIVFTFTQVSPASSQWRDILDDIKKALGGQSENEIVEGLKEALRVGTSRAVEKVAKVNGYFNNSKIRIPLPEPVLKTERLIRAAGFAPQLDEFELSMNRAAEKAAPEAKTLFWDAAKGISFSDARKILNGRDNEATLYFQDKTAPRLGEIAKPIVRDAMGKVGVTRRYQELDGVMRTLPLVGKYSIDLDQYVTDKALDGLFFMLGEEEKRIRENPAARTTDLLKKVFGK